MLRFGLNAPCPGALRPHRTKGRTAISNSKIFVGNLNFETSREELEHLLSEVGRIRDVYMPADRATGRPRGFAFVEFDTPEAAQSAIEKFDGHELGGRALRVNEAQERRPRAPRPAPGGSGGFDAPRGGHDGWSGNRPSRPKGSRRGARGKKRSL